MPHYKILVPFFIVTYYICFASGASISPQLQAYQNLKLSLSEQLFIKISDACRAVLDLRFNTLMLNEGMVNTIKIIKLEENGMKIYPIKEAYASLTNNGSFDITKQTKVIIHGFKDHGQSDIPLEIGTAYLKQQMFNVLLVDAEQILSAWYVQSVYNTRLVGKRIANLLANLEHFGANAEDFHLVGISLGAHIAGFVGKYFRRYKNRNIGRISGLDPAGPCYSFVFSDQRLDLSDADYVDVVHTNKMMQGALEPLGHADFYINSGGPGQPGCILPSCSHLRAAQIYAESIRKPMSFVGIRCQSWRKFTGSDCSNGSDYAVLGYGSSTSTRGVYYLKTNASPPFGLGMKGASVAKSKKNTFKNFIQENK